jgi:hypothetical protein
MRVCFIAHTHRVQRQKVRVAAHSALCVPESKFYRIAAGFLLGLRIVNSTNKAHARASEQRWRGGGLNAI